MPFIARDEGGEQHIAYMVPPELYRQGWECPLCGDRMAFVDSTRRQKHFRHLHNAECEWEPETAAHLEGKRWLYEHFPGKEREYEKRVCFAGECVVADVAIVDGPLKIALEIQTSPLREEALDRKAMIYYDAGWIDIWFLVIEPEGRFLHRRDKYVYQLKAIERDRLDLEGACSKWRDRGKLVRGLRPLSECREYKRHAEMEENWFFFDFNHTDTATGHTPIFRQEFKPKWARGGEELFCETLFIASRRQLYSPEEVYRSLWREHRRLLALDPGGVQR